METDQSPSISVVIPTHNEQGNVDAMYEALTPVMSDLGRAYEILFVNDGSRDHTQDRLRSIAEKDGRVRVIELARNFGQTAALCAGFEAARGQIILTVDCDLQNDPADLPKLLAELERGYAVVGGWRRGRTGDFLTRVLPSRVANRLIASVTGLPFHDFGSGMKAYRSEVVKGKYLPDGMNRFMPAIFGVGPEAVAEIEISDRERRHGGSHYGLWRTFVVTKDLLTVPFAIRGARRYARLFGGVAAATGVCCAGAAFAVLADVAWCRIPVLALLGLSLMCLSAYVDLRRFVRAQDTKGFRIRSGSKSAREL